MELPNELVEELLMRLPIKSIMRFNCVTKSWNELIFDPNFRRRYESRNNYNISRPKGFFYHAYRPEFQHLSPCMPSVGPAKFIYASNGCEQREELKSLDYLHKFGYVLATSKGLILLSRNPMEYHVYDLVSKNHHKLPKNLKKYHSVSVGFICKYEENKNHLNYKVVRVQYSGWDTSHKVETYTSETRKWRKSFMKSDHGFKLGQNSVAKVIAGILYWKEWYTNRIVAYDPDDNEGRAKIIELPWVATDVYGMRTYEGTRDGSLQCVRVTNMIEIWILKSNKQDCVVDRSNWELTRKFKLSELGIKGWDFRQEDWYSYPYLIDINPANKNIIYLSSSDKIYSYDQDEDKIEDLDQQKLEVKPLDLAYFEWPIWPLPLRE